MSDFAPPTGPPPPKVPEGWKAVWNAQYSEYFYVNLYTKQSQWEKPTSPVYPQDDGHAPPAGQPPTYGNLGTNNPYASGGRPLSNAMSEDERLARKLQEEENARSHGGQPAGTNNDYYTQSGSTPQPGQYGYGQQAQYPPEQQAQPAKSGHKGLLGKLISKASGAGSSRPQSYPPQPQGYGAPYGGRYQQQGMMYGQPGRRPGGGMGGMGPMGAGALGLGGGLLAGSMLADAGDHGGDGGDGGGDYGGGDGGGDYGGGDGGGDFGGGDFGGGDMGGGDF